MITFEDQYKMAQQITGDTSPEGLIIFKRDINEGGSMFLNRLGRKFNKEYIRADLEAGKQYYQLPMGALRISSVRALHGTFWHTPRLIASEDEWNARNTITYRSNYPIYYYIRGFKEVGLYPIPMANTADGLEISYEPQHVELTQADYTAGTVTVSNGAVAVTHSASGFTPQMVGRWLQVTDGTDGKWYRIASYASTSQLSLENYYEGISGSGRSFRIGECMKIPEAYQDAPVYYAVDRFYLTQNDQDSATRFSQRFDLKLRSAKETYGKSTSKAGIKNNRNERNPRWIDLTPPVTYP